MGIANPQELDRKEYWCAWGDYLFLRKLNRDHQKSIIREVLIELFTKQQNDS